MRKVRFFKPTLAHLQRLGNHLYIGYKLIGSYQKCVLIVPDEY
jgi:hypothetical protein